jgi:hypothetical protein
MAPSHSRDAVETSELKSMCPGESIRLIRYSFDSGGASGDVHLSREKKREMAELSIVMPRSCSSGRESRYRILPACLAEMTPLVAIKASLNEVLPWSWSDLVSGRLDFFGARNAYHMCQDTYLRDVSKTMILWTVLYFLTHIADSIALLLKFDELFRRYDGHFDGGGGRGVR